MSELAPTNEVPQVPTPESLIAQVDWGEQQAVGEDVPVGETAAPDEQAPPDDTEQSHADPEQEQLARSRGWVAKEEWKGRPSDWVDAEVYIERTNHVLPVVAKEAKKLREELRAEREERVRMLAEIVELRKHYQEQQEAAQTIQFQTLQAERARAQEEGDYKRANEISDQLLDLKLAQKVALPRQQPPQQRLDPAVKAMLDDFTADNPMFKPEDAQVKLAVAAQQLAAAGTTKRGRELLDDAGRLAMRLFPDDFKAPVRRPAMAEMNGAPSRSSGVQRSWGDLKPEVARQQEDFIRSTPQLAKQDPKKVRASILADLPASAFRR